MSDNVKISVIVVSYNNISSIAYTLDSLLMQTYRNYEVIIIDADSDDGSKEVLQSYLNKFTDILYISEPDMGIYDGMNKGVDRASGDFVYFLNLGDRFCAPDTIERAVAELGEDDIYYGSVIIDGKEKKYPRQLSLLYFLCGCMVCHQAIFARKHTLVNLPFDIDIRICADRVWLTSQYRMGARIKRINVPIAEYDHTGISSDYEKYKVDSLKAAEKTFGKFGVRFIQLKRICGKLLGRRH